MTRLNSIPVHAPKLGQPEISRLLQCVQDGDASGNSPTVRAFERAFADRVGAKHALAVSSGSAALHLAFDALGAGPDTEVIVPSMTFAPCADMATLLGAKVVYADCDPRTFNLTADTVRPLLSPKTRVVLAVHMYGHPCALGPLRELCDQAGVTLLEDCAQATGARYQDRPVGAFGVAGCYSFYANKHITTGEGGMVTTDDDNLNARLKSLRSHCLTPADPRPYHRSRAAYNYRMPAFAAAVGLSQLSQFDAFMATRDAAAARYRERLDAIGGVSWPAPTADCTRHARWANVVVFDHPNASQIAQLLRDRGVQTRPFYYPLHLHDAVVGPQPELPTCQALVTRGLVLPSGNTLTTAQVDTVCDALAEVLA